MHRSGKTWDRFSHLQDGNTDDCYIIKIGGECNGSNMYELIYKEFFWSVR